MRFGAHLPKMKKYQNFWKLARQHDSFTRFMLSAKVAIFSFGCYRCSRGGHYQNRYVFCCSGICLRVFRLVPGFQRNLFSHSPVPLNNWLYQSSSFDLPVSLILFFFFSVFDFLWPVMFSLHPQWERSLHMSLMIRETEYQTDLVINQWYVSYIGTT